MSITGSQTPILGQDSVIVGGADGRGLYVNNTDLSPVSTNRLLCIALHSTAEQFKAACLPSKAHS
ncbi:unnamed protein product [Staurois parvus]|uniref:Uncharacterized protein n=1 Tax=Staurois parvus TaxID=386267 RepID=A0ABN9B0Z4_9NEOB|nr:unnamed protein product [Staurois parvus]